MSSTNRGSERRKNDFYETPGWCVRALLRTVDLPDGRWLEPAVGRGAIVKAVNEFRPSLDRSWTGVDIESRTWDFTVNLGDFRDFILPRFDVVITNPPFLQSLEFAEKALKVGKVVVMLMRLNWLASVKRNQFLRENPPSVYVLPKRPSFTDDGWTDATDYAWFVWGLTGRPYIKVIDVEDCK